MKAPNIFFTADFINDPQTLLTTLLAKIIWDERMKARKTASFGVAYNYSGMQYDDVTMLPELKHICDQIEKALHHQPNNCLLNYYPDGLACMGYHSDSIEKVKSGVSIISLGCERHILFRHKRDRHARFKYLLTNGSLLYMSQDVQQDWLHAIPTSEDKEARLSLTFRDVLIS